MRTNKNQLVEEGISLSSSVTGPEVLTGVTAGVITGVVDMEGYFYMPFDSKSSSMKAY